MTGKRKSLALAILLLASGLGGRFAFAQWLAESRATDSVTLRRPLGEFPERIDAWFGTDVPADPMMIRDIKIDEYLQRAFVHPSGERVMLWMSYSKRSTDQYHYPTVCMRGAGWTESREARETVRIDGQASAMRFAFTRASECQLVYYWYYLLGEESLDRWMRQLGKGARGFLRGRRNGSMTVEIFGLSERPDAKLLDDFARRVSEELATWLPPQTATGHEPSAAY